MTIPRHKPRIRAPGQRLGRAGLLSLLAVVALATTVEAQDPPFIQAASHNGVREGDVLTLTGSGLHLGPEDCRVFIGSNGSVASGDVLGSTPGGLEVEVGPVPSTGVETLTLWSGEEFALPDTVLPVSGRTYLLTGASWFIAAEEATLTPMVLLEASPEAQGGRLEGIDVRVAAPTPPSAPVCTSQGAGGFGCYEIEIKVVAVTGGGEPPPPIQAGGGRRLNSSTASAGGVRVMASLSMRLMATSSAPSPAAFAADVAQALDQTFGPVGLAAAAEGQEVVISYGGGLTSGSALIARVLPAGFGPGSA